MTIITKPISETLCLQIYGRVGFPVQYGEVIYGEHEYGSNTKMYSIYQRRHLKKGVCIVRERFYKPPLPPSGGAIANNAKFANAVLSWQTLTKSSFQCFSIAKTNVWL
jgi:hypothetical protein